MIHYKYVLSVRLLDPLTIALQVKELKTSRPSLRFWCYFKSSRLQPQIIVCVFVFVYYSLLIYWTRTRLWQKLVPSKRNQRAHGPRQDFIAFSSSKPSNVGGRSSLKGIAASALLNMGLMKSTTSLMIWRRTRPLENQYTTYYAADSNLSEWSTISKILMHSDPRVHVTGMRVFEIHGRQGKWRNVWNHRRSLQKSIVPVS